MGLLDTINCEYPLPNHKHLESREFQTKCLEEGLNHYTITEDGNLMLDDEIVPHTGWVNFYNYDYLNDNDNNEYTYCFDFSAEFFRGKLMSLEDQSYVEFRNIYTNNSTELSLKEFNKLHYDK